MFDEIFVAAFYVRFNMIEQVINRITVKAFIIIPMTVMCGFSVDLYYFGTHGNLYLFNSVKNQGTESAVKTIQVNEVIE